MRRTALPGVLLLLGLAGCGAGVQQDPAELAPWLRQDPRRCLLPRDLSQTMETHAARCAERFLAENGYTESVASLDTARVVAERGERSVTPAVLERRYATLDGGAAMVQCSRRECFVFFEVRERTRPCELRAVIMTWVFTQMRIRPGTLPDPRCSRPVQS